MVRRWVRAAGAGVMWLVILIMLGGPHQLWPHEAEHCHSLSTSWLRELCASALRYVSCCAAPPGEHAPPAAAGDCTRLRCAHVVWGGGLDGGGRLMCRVQRKLAPGSAPAPSMRRRGRGMTDARVGGCR